MEGYVNEFREFGHAQTTMENTLRKQFIISSFDIDPLGKARLTSIANYLQETAYKHAASLNLGYRHLAKEGRAWVLSRLKIKLYDYPEWDQVIEVETWPRGIEKLFALRDFRIRSEDGDLLAEASTCWIMVDMQTHRPVRFDNDFIPFEIRTDAVFPETPGKIAPPENSSECFSHRAQYSDLDVVGHVNNVKFIEWCLDGIEPSLLLDRGISEFEINYLSEVKAGEDVKLYSSSAGVQDDRMLISGSVRAEESECIRASLGFF
jgi:acyl-ACP thioesterase